MGHSTGNPTFQRGNSLETEQIRAVNTAAKATAKSVTERLRFADVYDALLRETMLANRRQYLTITVTTIAIPSRSVSRRNADGTFPSSLTLLPIVPPTTASSIAKSRLLMNFSQIPQRADVSRETARFAGKRSRGKRLVGRSGRRRWLE